MSGKIRECWNCSSYRAYYTKGFCQFDKQRAGLCCRRTQTVEDKHQSCEFWRSTVKLKNLRKQIAIKKLNEILESMLQIKQIFSEEKEEDGKGL